MAVSKRAVLTLGLAVVMIAGAGIGVQQLMRRADPCHQQDKAVLMERYPKLRQLAERQQAESEALLREHRRQDIRINLEMSGEEISPEDAMRLSMQQIDDLAALRERHRQEFEERCRDLVHASE